MTSQPSQNRPVLPTWFVAGTLALGVLGTLVAAVIIGVAGYDSESAGVTATYAVALPLGLVWGAGIGALIGRFALGSSPTAAKVAPGGCGCLSGILLLVVAVLFFEAIFPAL